MSDVKNCNPVMSYFYCCVDSNFVLTVTPFFAVLTVILHWHSKHNE